jgi:hypothetical protein
MEMVEGGYRQRSQGTTTMCRSKKSRVISCAYQKSK